MSKQSWAVSSAIVGLLLTQVWLHTIPTRVMAQEDQAATAPEARAAFEPVTFSVDGPTQRLEMVVATSRILTLDHKIPQLLVNNPEVVRATPISPNQVQVSALRPGVTQLNVWDETQRLYTIDVVVNPDARQLQMLIKSEFPDAAVRVRPLAASVYLTGYVPSPGMVASIVRIAEDYYPKVVNNMTVGGVQQVLLKTKIMEVSRTKLRRAGFDWAFLDSQGFVMQSVSGLVGRPSIPGTVMASGADTVRFGIVDGNSAFFGFIDALRQNDLIKVLAEPQLTTVSGRPASFNSGGEFPIIVPQSLGTVSIEYRQYGTRVDFVPIVLGNGNLRLEVRPQISEIDTSRSVIMGSTTVPALRTRWVDTAAEMKAGQTLALAGLLQQRVEAQNRGIPWLADLPWFGAPFRHIEEELNEVELLIMVTPEFAEAVDPSEVPPCGPGESTTSPNDVELYARGYMEVPRCCEDGSCPSCQSAPHEVSFPADAVGPDPACEPTPAETVGRGSTAPPRPSSATAPAAVPASRDASAADARSAAKKPALIGPVGYDALK